MFRYHWSLFSDSSRSRFVDSVSTVVNKDLVNAQGLVYSPPVKEKKKVRIVSWTFTILIASPPWPEFSFTSTYMAWQGIFASVIKDNKSAKSRNGHEAETQDCRKGIEELSTIFSTANFARDVETEEKNVSNEDDDDLDIGNFSLSILRTISRPLLRLSNLRPCCSLFDRWHRNRRPQREDKRVSGDSRLEQTEHYK